jgi:hypothetical protein
LLRIEFLEPRSYQPDPFFVMLCQVKHVMQQPTDDALR